MCARAVFVPLTTAAELQDWRALFKILRDVQLTEKFERPVDKKYLQRTLGLEEEEERAEREDGLEATKEPEIVSMKEDVNLVLEEEETQHFDPEDPEGADPQNGDSRGALAQAQEDELSMPLGFQLLKHVDSPEPEEPDEA